jgi:hypothetical protein
MTNVQPRLRVSAEGYERLQRELTTLMRCAAPQPLTVISMKTMRLCNEQGTGAFSRSMMC